MFTGLVECQGQVAQLRAEGAAVRLEIGLPEGYAVDAQLGESVAINGCCLTVVERTDGRLAFQAGEETLSKTNLGALRRGDAVNLERSLPVGARLGGHFVQGHVDGTGTIERIETDGEWTTMEFSVPPELALQMVAKGSVAVDGISLTLVRVDGARFSVALIPHTLSVTTLGRKRVGDRVNIETDILGKYIQKFIGSLSPPRQLES